MAYNKKFLVIGNINAITYREIFPLIKNNELWIGYNCTRHFCKPDGTLFETARTYWYTNLDIAKRHEKFILHKKYNPNDYPKYDNYNAIEVSQAVNIPMGYDGAMGVPITFLDKYNPEQFELLSSNDYRIGEHIPFKEHGLIKDKDGTINGKPTYVRILIKHKGVN